MKGFEDRLGFKPREVAAFVGISVAQIYRLIEQDKIKAVRIGQKRLVVPRAEVERLVAVK